MSRILLFGLVILTLAIPVFAAPKPEQDTAVNWLTLIDTQRFDQSWNESSAFLKEHIPQAQWAKTLTDQRMPLGKPTSRVIVKKEFQYQIPGIPTGTYEFKVYRTTFPLKGEMTETVIMSRESDQKWRAIAYYIK
jgi:hypothetical protein